MTASRAEAEQAKTPITGDGKPRPRRGSHTRRRDGSIMSAAAFVAQRRIDALSGGDDGDGSASTDGDDGKNADERAR